MHSIILPLLIRNKAKKSLALSSAAPSKSCLQHTPGTCLMTCYWFLFSEYVFPLLMEAQLVVHNLWSTVQLPEYNWLQHLFLHWVQLTALQYISPNYTTIMVGILGNSWAQTSFRLVMCFFYCDRIIHGMYYSVRNKQLAAIWVQSTLVTLFLYIVLTGFLYTMSFSTNYNASVV